MSLAPPSLPPYIFLMSDHTTTKLAAEVADELSKRYPSVFVDDFLAPIHEAFITLFSLDWKRDMGNPVDVGPTERDQIVSLEKWFIEQFGEHRLGQMALERAEERNTTADYITVFRDATNAHISGFASAPANNQVWKTVILKPDDNATSIVAIIERM